MQANPFILGLLAPTQVVAFFGGAEKIVRAAVALIQPLSQTFFPRLSHLITKDTRKAGGIFRVTVFSIVGLGLIMGLTTFVAAPVLVKLLLGPGYEEAVPVLRILAVLPPVIGVGTAFGIQWALPVGLERPFYSLVIAAGVVNVGLAVLLVPGFGGEGMALAVLAAEVLVAAGLLSLFRLKGGSFRPLRLPDTALDSGD
jgi:PST family polysaccharide transporter